MRADINVKALLIAVACLLALNLGLQFFKKSPPAAPAGTALTQPNKLSIARIDMTWLDNAVKLEIAQERKTIPDPKNRPRTMEAIRFLEMQKQDALEMSATNILQWSAESVKGREGIGLKIKEIRVAYDAQIRDVLSGKVPISETGKTGRGFDDVFADTTSTTAGPSQTAAPPI